MEYRSMRLRTRRSAVWASASEAPFSGTSLLRVRTFFNASSNRIVQNLGFHSPRLEASFDRGRAIYCVSIVWVLDSVFGNGIPSKFGLLAEGLRKITGL